MSVKITPQRPVIFLNQPFTVQITVNPGTKPIPKLSAQIKSICQSPFPIVRGQSRTTWAYDSDICDLGTNISKDGTFCITIKAERAPPSFEGKTTIIYNLYIFGGPNNDLEMNFPVVFITPHDYHASVAGTPKIHLEAVESASSTAKLALSCPFITDMFGGSNEFVVNREGGIVARVSLPTVTTAGKDLIATVNLKDSNTSLSALMAAFVMTEQYNGEDTQRTEVLWKRVDLNDVVMKKFALSIPYFTAANFTVDSMSVHYSVELTFISDDGKWKWACEIDVLPPEFSLTKPRRIK